MGWGGISDTTSHKKVKMSGNKMALNQTFQEKMRDKIREDIGNLLTDEGIKFFIEKGIVLDPTVCPT